ncbi:MAG: N-acetylglucosamine kinase [Clostridia bacterium]|nr:N-acetylglucosamine kinase [Clostridia bacterium]
MKKYVLGVDGGNSKTEYFLFTADGHMVDGSRKGTCSHERFPGAYETSKQVMGRAIHELLSRNQLDIADLSAAAFGLAGADLPFQKTNLDRVLRELGFARFVMDNDGFLGVKAGCRDGYGVCSINGSGSVCTGIGMDGRRVQIGGLGADLTGDEAGGHYLAHRTLRMVYDQLFRMGPKTALTDAVFSILCISDPDSLMETVCQLEAEDHASRTELVRALLAACDAGDAVAQAVVRESANALAQNTLGCLNRLHFEGEVTIVQTGSVWAKAETPLFSQWYQERVRERAGISCRFHILREPPATGAVLWALELERGHPADEVVTRRVFDEVRAFQAR